MIVDYLLEFTSPEGQELTAAAASEFCIDFGQEAPTTGMDTHPMVAVFNVTEAVTGNLKISLQHCDTKDGTFEDVASAVEFSAPAAGTQVVIPLPYHHKRFMQAYFGGSAGTGENAAAGPTAGKIRGFITTGVQDNVPFKVAPSFHTAS